MYQIQGTTKLHPFAAYSNMGVEATVLTTPVCKYRINGGTVTTFTPTITYTASMKTFLITIPATLAVNAYDSIEVYISAAEGEAHLLIDVATDMASLIYKLKNKSKVLR